MIEGLIEQFAALEDPRCAGKVEHRLDDEHVIAVCAAVAGAESFEDVALYGRCKERWLRGFLPLAGGVPSHDTFCRVLMLIDPEAFLSCRREVADQITARGADYLLTLKGNQGRALRARVRRGRSVVRHARLRARERRALGAGRRLR